MALQFRNGYGLSGAIMDITTYKRWMGQRTEHFTLSWKGEISSTIEFCIINFGAEIEVASMMTLDRIAV